MTCTTFAVRTTLMSLALIAGHCLGSSIVTTDFSSASDPIEVKGMSSGPGVTAVADVSRVGTIDAAGATTPSPAIRLLVRSTPSDGEWSAAAVAGPVAIRNSETDLRKLTFSFMGSVSSLQPISVRVESVDAAGRTTGASIGEVFPAAPNFFQRFAVELATLTAEGGKPFDPRSSLVRLSFGLKSEPGLPAAATRELRIDNVALSSPSFYVSPTGDDTHDGKTEATAVATPQKAVEKAGPGDIILVKGGEYHGRGDAVKFLKPGTPAGWIVLKNAPGETPVLTSSGWSVIRVGLGSKELRSESPGIAYIEMRGLRLIGSNSTDAQGNAVSAFPKLLGKVVAETNGNGLHIEGRYSRDVIHHIRVADCEISQNAGAGVGACFTDWVYIENNVTRDNAWFTNYACSGISILLGSAFDGTTGGYRFLVSGNHSSGNRSYQMWTASSNNDAPKKLSDGNGIIIDTLGGSMGNKNEKLPPFTGRTLVVNNVSFNNGGSGIHLVSSPNVDLINNTTYLNSASPELHYSQLYGYRSPGSRFVNNIAVAPEGEKYNTSSKYGEVGNTDNVWSNNLYFGSTATPKPGTDDLIVDPLFVKASRDPKVADFTLRSGSPAIGAGTRAVLPVPLTDIDGRRRPMDRSPSIGASQP